MAESLKAWLSENPPDDGLFTASIAGTARRLRAGEPLSDSIKELLDELALMNPSQIQRAISERPEDTGDERHNAYLGALAEHIAAVHHVRRPEWSHEPDRFLNTFWFLSEVKGFRALALVESPAAFRRRGVFISSGSLIRV
ncbi:MAG: hypothetical protein WD627_12560 [Actinomycetota bacterium]